jgi:hypothetical protein
MSMSCHLMIFMVLRFMVNMTSLQKFLKTSVKQVNNQNLKMATAKGIRTSWMVLKLVPSHAVGALNLYLSIIMQFFKTPSPAGHRAW